MPSAGSGRISINRLEVERLDPKPLRPSRTPRLGVKPLHLGRRA